MTDVIVLSSRLRKKRSTLMDLAHLDCGHKVNNNLLEGGRNGNHSSWELYCLNRASLYSVDDEDHLMPGAWQFTPRSLLVDPCEADRTYVRNVQIMRGGFHWPRAIRLGEANLSVEIGATLSGPLFMIADEVGPLCKTSACDASPAQPVADGSDEQATLGAGWAPKTEKNMFVDQVRGIFAVAEKLKRDPLDMLGRYRNKLKAAGTDVQAFDDAVVVVVTSTLEQ